jgi:hypothetical protein
LNFELSRHGQSPLRFSLRRSLASCAVLGYLAWPLGCSSPSEPFNNSGGAPQSTGGAAATSGGAPATGGVPSTTGGSPPTGGSPTGGTVNTGGSTVTTGGLPSTGGIGSGGVGTGGSAGQNTSGGSIGGVGAGTGGQGGRPSDGGSSTGGSGGGFGKGGSGGASGGGGKGGASGGDGGNGGAITTGGSGGGASYQPCPTNGDPCKILPLGDSITWGIQYDGAYRVELFNKAHKAGQKITFTGSLSNGPSMVDGVAFPKQNEGHSGWTIAQDTGLVPSPAFNTIPNIVLLMIGTNDVYASSGQAQMPDRLGALLDKIFAAAPNALLVVGKITPLNNASWNQTIKTYNDAIPGLVQTRANAGKHVIWVDLNTGFTSSMLSSDNIHPNKSGYDFMAGVWYTAISNLLPK